MKRFFICEQCVEDAAGVLAGSPALRAAAGMTEAEAREMVAASIPR